MSVDFFFEFHPLPKGLETSRYTGNATQVWIPAKVGDEPVLKVGNGTFSHNDTLRAVAVQEGILEVGSGAFEMCPVLIEVNLPSTLISVDRDAFIGSKRARIFYMDKQYYSDQVDMLIHDIEQNLLKRYKLDDLERDGKTLIEVMSIRSNYKEWFQEAFPAGATSAEEVLQKLHEKTTAEQISDMASAFDLPGNSGVKDMPPDVYQSTKNLTYPDKLEDLFKGDKEAAHKHTDAEFEATLKSLVTFLSQIDEHKKWFAETFPNGADSLSGALLQLIGQFNF